MLTVPAPPGARADVQAVCAAVLGILLPHRRTLDAGHGDTPDAFPAQLRQLAGPVAAGEPIVFTLPGFPCKSPNPAKVLGHLPDEGERLALRFLDGLCARIAAVHPPGARMVICSDGHVFSDLIQVPDRDIDAYADALRTLLHDEGLTQLDVFDLRDVYGQELSHDAKRTLVHERYAPALETLQSLTRTDEPTRRLYQGITRFLFEDSVSFAGTRSARQRSSRRRAYGVMQRSRAWGDLIAAHHPGAFRLSIHPQPRGSAKFGIRLLDAPDVWLTPWHSCVLEHPDGRRELLHRADAERLGRPVLRQGRPSHFAAG
ncbi:pyoverdine/dityrosine biosynthesis protein Dit1 [Streptomyces sp. 2333.5]|nr:MULTISPECIES: isocyanide synthase family protein [unclassified Streptomyces]PJJ00336.1 pyoverdine/dityrosine biosynthesis protein Dit1 [Streptomyces sp. 2333.5]SEB87818.1 Pyoverdine/dityrosine biosynthesis protein Dit1 [Streptomyces sp. 2314.4]SEC75914.1 Pyoverdine/dityrosine biosynthesis protein Dit1 [Streptomyces sp. 2112.2]SOE15553.1 Pyoverdine/dityrosine biosynthesis protein Dit1 [Streptomyces sp. 2323.1]